MISKIRLYRIEKNKGKEKTSAWGTCKISGVEKPIKMMGYYNRMRGYLNIEACEPISVLVYLDIVTRFQIPCSSEEVKELLPVPLILARMNKRSFVWR